MDVEGDLVSTPAFTPDMVGHVVEIVVAERGNWGVQLSVEAGVLEFYYVDVVEGQAAWKLAGADQTSQRPYRRLAVKVTRIAPTEEKTP